VRRGSVSKLEGCARFYADCLRLSASIVRSHGVVVCLGRARLKCFRCPWSVRLDDTRSRISHVLRRQMSIAGVRAGSYFDETEHWVPA
jgi:hypothetical protein